MERTFDSWFSSFRDSIATYDYYVDFNKVYQNVDAIKVELNILNSLVGSKNIKDDFETLAKRYPEILKCIPILLAIRDSEIYARDEQGDFCFNFKEFNYSLEQYMYFMEKTGLFDLLSNKIINNIVDYVLGVETGLDSNARKNRGGKLMASLLESYIKDAGFIKNVNYFEEMTTNEITKRWGLDLSSLTNNGKAKKRFDFVIKTETTIYGIETNFYNSNGSKLNEVARSYKTIALESRSVEGFEFVWFTDGKGWLSARYNLEETFDIMEHLYNIKDLENDILKSFA